MPHIRHISQEVEKVLRSLSPRIVVQRNSVDDFCLDCSDEVANQITSQTRVQLEDFTAGFLDSDNGKVVVVKNVVTTEFAMPVIPGMSEEDLRTLLIARQLQILIAAELGGMTCSASVGRSTVLTRLVVGLNKPNGLTIIKDLDARGSSLLMSTTPLTNVHYLRRIRGHQIAERLKSAIGKDEIMVSDLAMLDEIELVQLFGSQEGLFLHALGRGQVVERIQDRGPPKSILVELTGFPVHSGKDVQSRLEPLVEDLLNRIVSDSQRFNGRWPTKLVVRWRRTGGQCGSSTVPMPGVVAGFLRNTNELMVEPSMVPGYAATAAKISQAAVSAVLQSVDGVTKKGQPRNIDRFGVVAHTFVDGANLCSLESFFSKDADGRTPKSREPNHVRTISPIELDTDESAEASGSDLNRSGIQLGNEEQSSSDCEVISEILAHEYRVGSSSVSRDGKRPRNNQAHREGVTLADFWKTP